MAENPDFEGKVRNSFSNVKEDINNLKEALNQQKEDISSLKSKIDSISKIVSEIKDNLVFFKKNSTGNEGVNNNQQQSTTINNTKQSLKETSIILNPIKSTISEISQSLTFSFKNLTDREFSVFISIFELGKQLPEVTYTDISQKLKISEPTVRNAVNQLISKKMPIQKTRFFNRKVSLFVTEDFQDLNLLSKLIKLRQNPHNQKTLFDV